MSQFQSQSAPGPVVVEQSGTKISQRQILNFISGSGATVSVVDDPSNNSADITVSAGGASSFQFTPSVFTSSMLVDFNYQYIVANGFSVGLGGSIIINGRIAVLNV